MRLGIIGAGHVGGTLGKRWAELGHTVTFGVRDPTAEKVRELLASIHREVLAFDLPTAAAASDIIVLATPWLATEAAVRACGDITGKIVIDCTNPWVWGEGLKVGFTTSGAEQIASWARGARVYKTLNQTGYEVMADPAFVGGQRAMMCVAGDDAAGKRIVIELVTELGFDTVDAGPLSAARLLEPIAALWIDLVTKFEHDRRFAFGRLLRHNPPTP